MYDWRVWPVRDVLYTAERRVDQFELVELVDRSLDNRRLSAVSSLCLLHRRSSALQYIRLRRPQGNCSRVSLPYRHGAVIHC